MGKIKFVDPLITLKRKKYFRKAFNSGWLSDGPYVEKFEKLSNLMGNNLVSLLTMELAQYF